MPQMSPMNWMMLFMMFLSILLIMVSKMYFSIFFSPEKEELSTFSLKITNTKWMW